MTAKKPSKCTTCGNRISTRRKSGSTICGLCWIRERGHNPTEYKPKKCLTWKGPGTCPHCKPRPE